MRNLFATISLLGGIGWAFTAGASEAPRQCPAPWMSSQTAPICRAGGTCPVPAGKTLLTAYDAPEHHLLSKAEARAELDAIRIDSNDTRLARRADRPTSGE